MKVAKLSLCSCGEALFNNNIQIGHEYLIDESRTPGTIQCGGCGGELDVTLVRDLRIGTVIGAMLPIEALEEA